ncbi:hypothetical protein TpMuguga_02g00501 [Theileria parva strain Muguga]|uniref:Uncharacterized protein n=1 Tax=Theileria parva TaxID=5875 RepID=Q4N4Y9_THEPA|nr:uncharacterized protein TpMuguga_02g00501 [Theileria parva strain Muguga]EAN32784.1 hypothetical protein TpMuguga_02g00501 [Theileria parva strain Muguga]|eukprot:XP_765067.1 hypothetical protein [Theileria parva strain Muguga]
MNSKNTCLCVDKLNQLHNTIHTELTDCKDKVWNFKISSLTKERDSLLLRYDPFLLVLFTSYTHFPDTPCKRGFEVKVDRFTV